jgi:UDP-N-acetylmuramoyl-L-alanyl-D-glutamate--2,6-diaminopimelate ligase
MRLDELLEGIETLDLGNVYPDMEVSAVTNDNRKVTPGSIFVAIKGEKSDGHDYIESALSAGATAVVQSRPLNPGTLGSFIRVADTRATYAEMCAKLAGHPSRELRVIGVTGTNGKTSTVLLIRHLLLAAGYNPAALGTLGLLKPGSQDYEQRGLTTPDAGQLQQMMRELADAGATHLIMEVSSHALVQQRVAAVEFAGGVFTNLTQDHFDYHNTFEEYRDAKALLFRKHLVYSGGYAVLNGDDETGLEYSRHYAGVKVIYGASPQHNLVLSNIACEADGLSWNVVVKNGVWPERLRRNINHARFETTLIGRYNAYNCAAATGVALLEGLSLEQVIEALQTFPGVPGRLQRVTNTNGLHVFVDYAHTPDALENVLRAVREICQPGARVITVVGCGGDRDSSKRPLMGAAAQRGSDMLVITSDNPRSEDPDAIISQIVAGLTPGGCSYVCDSDRRSAIREALAFAKPGDIVLIAGKGHEDYQILGAQTIHFSDVEEAQAYFVQGVRSR